MKIIGSYLSPYVRKILVCLDVKGISYEIDPIIPFFGDDRFSKMSPLRRIPVLVDGDLVLSDSSVIFQYLEELVPSPSLLPTNIKDRAKARWLEEYADTRMGDIFIWQLYEQIAIKPFVWGGQKDEALVQKTLTQDIPQILDYLEKVLPQNGFLFGDLSLADISIAVFFCNAAFVRYQVDASRWPITAAFVDRMFALPSFQKLKPFEDKLLKTKIHDHRSVLATLGAPLTEDSYGTSQPRKGIMR